MIPALDHHSIDHLKETGWEKEKWLVFYLQSTGTICVELNQHSLYLFEGCLSDSQAFGERGTGKREACMGISKNDVIRS